MLPTPVLMFMPLRGLIQLKDGSVPAAASAKNSVRGRTLSGLVAIFSPAVDRFVRTRYGAAGDGVRAGRLELRGGRLRGGGSCQPESEDASERSVPPGL